MPGKGAISIEILDLCRANQIGVVAIHALWDDMVGRILCVSKGLVEFISVERERKRLANMQVVEWLGHEVHGEVNDEQVREPVVLVRTLAGFLNFVRGNARNIDLAILIGLVNVS